TPRRSTRPRRERSCSPAGAAGTATTRGLTPAGGWGRGAAPRPATRGRQGRRDGYVLAPPVLLRGRAGRRGQPGAGDRLRGLSRPLLRAAPALRGPDQRGPRRSARLPLAVPGSTARPFANCNSYSAGVEDRVVPRENCSSPDAPAPPPRGRSVLRGGRTSARAGRR